jgi:hypothetical protein
MKFNSTQFLETVKNMYGAVKKTPTRRSAKNFIRSCISHCRFNKDDVFEWFKTILQAHDKGFNKFNTDKTGWKKIYKDFIKFNLSQKFTNLLEAGLELCSDAHEFEVWFDDACLDCGRNPDTLKTEIYIDVMDWRRMVDTLLKMAGEKSESETESETETENTTPEQVTVKKETKKTTRVKKSVVTKTKVEPVKEVKEVKEEVTTDAPKLTQKKKLMKPVYAYLWDKKNKKIGDFICSFTSQDEAAHHYKKNKSQISNLLNGNIESTKTETDGNVTFRREKVETMMG